MKLTAGTPAQTRRQLITLGVVTLIGVFLYFRFPWAPATTAEGTPAASNTPAAAPRAAATSQGLPEPLKLAALDAVHEETRGDRDPFGFGVPPRPPYVPPPPVVQRPTPTPEPPRDPGPPPRPRIPVKFLGFAEDPSRPGKVVTLSLNGAVVLAREGDVVDGKYRLIKVALTSIVMAYLDGQGQTVIPLTGT